MHPLQYHIDINAPVSKVFQLMIDDNAYRLWTSVFCGTSYFEGQWKKGEKMYFIGLDDQGNKGGMVAQIADVIPDKFISIQHYGILDGETEITEGPQVEAWKNVFENYTFSENSGQTRVTVDVATVDEYLDFFNDKWPKALDVLKEICEQ
jgi:uncharacterized protein YndB with AHSA1/START domain